MEATWFSASFWISSAANVTLSNDANMCLIWGGGLIIYHHFFDPLSNTYTHTETDIFLTIDIGSSNNTVLPAVHVQVKQTDCFLPGNDRSGVIFHLDSRGV